MNIQYRSRNLPRTSQAAEGLERRRWTVAEIEAMVEAGIIEEDERFELIGGEVVPMSPKGNRHELLKGALNRWWGKRVPDDVHYVTETTFHISDDTFLEPDFVFYKRSDGLVSLSPATALLVVEIADTSLVYDLGRKARLYAAYGVKELWVIDAVKLATHIHRRPGVEGYTEQTTVGAEDEIAPGFAAELAVRLGNLELV